MKRKLTWDKEVNEKKTRKKTGREVKSKLKWNKNEGKEKMRKERKRKTGREVN